MEQEAHGPKFGWTLNAGVEWSRDGIRGTDNAIIAVGSVWQHHAGTRRDSGESSRRSIKRRVRQLVPRRWSIEAGTSYLHGLTRLRPGAIGSHSLTACRIHEPKPAITASSPVMPRTRETGTGTSLCLLASRQWRREVASFRSSRPGAAARLHLATWRQASQTQRRHRRSR